MDDCFTIKNIGKIIGKEYKDWKCVNVWEMEGEDCLRLYKFIMVNPKLTEVISMQLYRDNPDAKKNKLLLKFWVGTLSYKLKAKFIKRPSTPENLMEDFIKLLPLTHQTHIPIHEIN